MAWAPRKRHFPSFLGTQGCFIVPATGGTSAAWSNAVALAWSGSGSTPKAVSMITDPDGTAWKFKVGSQTMVLDRNATAHAPDEAARVVTSLEAKSVSLNTPMQAYNDSTASGGKYIGTPIGTTPNIPDSLSNPSAQYNFNVAVTGTYAIWARVQGSSSSSNSFYYKLNPTGSTGYTLASVSTYNSWIWLRLSSSAALSAGNNVLALKYAAANCKIDQVIATDDLAYLPYGIY